MRTFGPDISIASANVSAVRREDEGQRSDVPEVHVAYPAAGGPISEELGPSSSGPRKNSPTRRGGSRLAQRGGAGRERPHERGDQPCRQQGRTLGQALDIGLDLDGESEVAAGEAKLATEDLDADPRQHG